MTDGGGQPNVVPPDAEVWYYIRANKHDDVVRYFGWVKEIAEGAAKMTRTTLAAVQGDTDMFEVLPNRTLSEVIHRNLELVGAKAYFVRDGLMKDVDVVLFSRVGSNLGTSWGSGSGNGLVSVEYTFRGVARRSRSRRASSRRRSWRPRCGSSPSRSRPRCSS